jgi:hypothetical protein
MQTFRYLLLLALVLSADAFAARAARTETEWMQVLLEGRKIGFSKNVRITTPERVVTSETLHVTLDRVGTAVHLETMQESTETPDGRALGFRFKSTLSGLATEVHGEVAADGTMHVSQNLAGRAEESTQAWPQGALLSEGMRRLERAQGLTPGTEYEALSFQPDLMAAMQTRTRVLGIERVSVFGKEQALTHVSQRIELPGAPMEVQLWVDSDFHEQRVQLPLLGMTLELVACDERLARAPDQPPDVLEHTVVAAPRALTPDELSGELRYTVVVPDIDGIALLPETGEQAVRKLGAGRFEVTVNRHAAAGAEAVPQQNDRAATRWLQSDAEELRQLADSALAGVEGERARMQRLEQFVREYIVRKDLRVGYASALETVRTREGDCTEHALLLAALGRAAGLATRVVDGLAYTERFGGRAQVFVPHAWAQAWVDGRWQSFDAALAGFDAGHIALNVGDGDPAGFYVGVSLLGQIRIERAEVAAP